MRCAPPNNKPTKEEFENCFIYLSDEWSILKNIKCIVCLGKIAFDSCYKILNTKGKNFSHGNSFVHGDLHLISSSIHVNKKPK